MSTIEEQMDANKFAEVTGLNVYKDALEELNVTAGFEFDGTDGDLIIFEGLLKYSRLISPTDSAYKDWLLFVDENLTDESNLLDTTVVYEVTNTYAVNAREGYIEFSYPAIPEDKIALAKSVVYLRYAGSFTRKSEWFFCVNNVDAKPDILNGSLKIYF